MMKNVLLSTLLLLTSPLVADQGLISSEEFVEYDIDDEEIFNLIHENINNLKNRDASNDSAKELINLIMEGYKIDPYNMSQLIELLIYKDASKNATNVIIKAIEYGSIITSEHMFCLLQTLTYADASNNATAVILKAIERGVKFGPKERTHLAEISKVMNAKKNVEKIRKALHERIAQN